MRVALGVSAAAHSGMLSGALDSAQHALQMAKLDQTPVSVVSGDEVTSYLRLLATVPDEVRRTFATRVLGAVLDYDKAHDAGLRETLETFLALSGSWSQTAAAMHLHVNTVRYRIARVASLTGRDLGRLEDGSTCCWPCTRPETGRSQGGPASSRMADRAVSVCNSLGRGEPRVERGGSLGDRDPGNRGGPLRAIPGEQLIDSRSSNPPRAGVVAVRPHRSPCRPWPRAMRRGTSGHGSHDV